MFEVVRYNDPSPSRLRYRFERLWLKPVVRKLVRVWIPLAMAGGVTWSLAQDPTVKAFAAEMWQLSYETVASRPELQVTSTVTPGASGVLAEQISLVLGLNLPVSSMDLDVKRIKDKVEGLTAVKHAQVRVLGDGTLEIQIEERVPALVWRNGDVLQLVDDTGHVVSEIARRSARPDLPLVVGEGAERSVEEAMALLHVAAPLIGRVRGLVRVGERRWDLVLDREQTIMLPEEGAIDALRRVLALDQADELLERDVEIIDMRDASRPTLRLTEHAIEELRTLRAEVRGENR